MPRKLRQPFNYHQPRFMQISESHCGPAVTQMMLSQLGIEVAQEQVAESGGATSLIAMNGMRIDQLAQAVRRLVPQVNFFVKEQATIDELVRVVIDYRHPVGVEWQGVFEDASAAHLDRAHQAWANLTAAERDLVPPDTETGETDYGHYSLVTNANRRRRELMVADPYKDFFSQARIFSFDVFDRRWFDYNEVIDPITGRAELVKDDHLMFVITRKKVLFPQRLGMRAI